MKKIFITLLCLSSNVFAGTLAEELKSIGVTPVIEKKTSERIKDNEYPEDRYFLQIKLGKLSESQFNSLLKRYGNQSRVRYNSNQNYELVDFLPPSMQALVNKTFQSSHLMVSSRNQEISYIFKNGVSVASNCFNTTFEIIRSVQDKSLELKHRFFIPDRWNATDLIQDAKYGQSVSPSKIRPYDVLYYTAKSHMGMNTLQHTAIYLSDDLVFEKTDAMENDPYRISYTADVKSKYSKLLPEMFVSHKLLGRRFLVSGKGTLPDLKVDLKHAPFSGPEVIEKLPAALKKMNLSMACETGLGGGCDINFYDVQEVQFTINNKTGRAQISGANSVLRKIIDL